MPLIQAWISQREASINSDQSRITQLNGVLAFLQAADAQLTATCAASGTSGATAPAGASA
ncbi:MAG: hypothetical protein ACYDA2_10520 [Acidimicrobiales bacterium]